MPNYRAPLRDMEFVFDEVLDACATLQSLPSQREFSSDLGGAILEEAAKVAENVFAPLNSSGDKQGCEYDPLTKTVKALDGFRAAYKQFAEGGWTALACSPEFGGQGLPHVLNMMVEEMLCSANLSLGIDSWGDQCANRPRMVGMQGLGIAQSAYQISLGFAHERLQNRSLSGPKAAEKPADPITVHPDVRRNLLRQKVMIEGCRALAYFTGLHQEVAQDKLDQGSPQTQFYGAKLKSADFFMACVLTETDSLLTEVRAGKSTLMAFSDEEFAA
jgi:alkylation response protein AidB-like acyl-CoA dehydrogenase